MGRRQTSIGWLRTSRSHLTFRSSTSLSVRTGPSHARPHKEGNVYICPAFKVLTTTGKIVNDDQMLYRSSKPDCDACPYKMRCCPKEPARKIPRSIYEEARDMARSLAKTEAFEQSCRDRKRIEMLFAHLRRILRLGRLRLRGPRGAQFEFTLAAIAQNLRRLAKLQARSPPGVAACVA